MSFLITLPCVRLPLQAIREKDGVFVVERLVERIVTTEAEIMALIAGRGGAIVCVCV